MEYYIFIQDDQDLERLVASTPSLAIARKTAERMANTDLDEHRTVSALLCAQEGDGKLEDLEIYYRGIKDPEILLPR